MILKNTFINGVNTVFSVLNDAVHQGQYIVVTDDGFGNVFEEYYTVRVILDKFTQKDVEFSSFHNLIQPTDIKGMIPGEDLPSSINTSNFLQIEDRKFTIVAFETDPLEVLFTFLLRDSK